MVKVKNVSKTFHNKDGSKVRALRNVDIDLDDTGITFISGASGNGKSTLLSILAGLTRFDSGDIIVDGVSFKNFNRKDFDAYWRTYIGFVFEDYNLVETLNVRENIKLGVLADGRVPTEEQIANVLKKVKLSGFEDRLVSQLSSGQRQRICIARALSVKPKLVVCDEPVSALDVSIQAQIINLLKDLQKNMGLTYLFISHDLSVVKYISDKIGVMYLGTMVEFGNKDDIFSNPLHPYTRALFSAIPNPNPDVKMERVHLEGDIPSPANPPKGCRFHTRCPNAMEVCKHVCPEYKEYEKGHFAACHLLDKPKLENK